MPPAKKKPVAVPVVGYVAMSATTTINGKTYKKELTATQNAGPKGALHGKYMEKNPGRKKAVVNLKRSNLATYLKRF